MYICRNIFIYAYHIPTLRYVYSTLYAHKIFYKAQKCEIFLNENMRNLTNKDNDRIVPIY